MSANLSTSSEDPDSDVNGCVTVKTESPINFDDKHTESAMHVTSQDIQQATLISMMQRLTHPPRRLTVTETNTSKNSSHDSACKVKQEPKTNTCNENESKTSSSTDTSDSHVSSKSSNSSNQIEGNGIDFGELPTFSIATSKSSKSQAKTSITGHKRNRNFDDLCNSSEKCKSEAPQSRCIKKPRLSTSSSIAGESYNNAKSDASAAYEALSTAPLVSNAVNEKQISDDIQKHNQKLHDLQKLISQQTVQLEKNPIKDFNTNHIDHFVYKTQESIQASVAALIQSKYAIESNILGSLAQEQEHLAFVRQNLNVYFHRILTQQNARLAELSNEINLTQNKLDYYNTRMSQLTTEKAKLHTKMVDTAFSKEIQWNDTSNQLRRIQTKQTRWNFTLAMCDNWLVLNSNQNEANNNSSTTKNNNDNANEADTALEGAAAAPETPKNCKKSKSSKHRTKTKSKTKARSKAKTKSKSKASRGAESSASASASDTSRCVANACTDEKHAPRYLEKLQNSLQNYMNLVTAQRRELVKNWQKWNQQETLNFLKNVIAYVISYNQENCAKYLTSISTNCNLEGQDLTSLNETVLKIMGITDEMDQKYIVLFVKNAIWYDQTNNNENVNSVDAGMNSNESASTASASSHNGVESKSATVSTAESGNHSCGNRDMCIVCANNKSCMVFVQCGHQSLCESCYEEWSKNNKCCPSCRAQSSQAIKVIVSGL